MTLRAQVLSGIRWTAGARLAAQVFAWAITLVVIRILSPADYGLLAMATVFVSLLSVFHDIGLGAAIVQRPSVEDGLLRQVFGAIVVLHSVLTALLVVSAPLIADFFGEPRLVLILRVLSLQFILGIFTMIPDAMLQRRMEYKWRSLLGVAGVIVGGVTSLLLALAGNGVWSLVWGSLATQLVGVIGLNVLSPFARWPKFAWQGMQPLVRFGGELTAAQVLWVVYSQSGTVIAGRLLGKEMLGIYSVAMHLAELPIQRIAGLINKIAFPTFARMQDDAAKVRETVLAGTRMLSFIGFPVLWGISSIAPEIVEVILGAKWASASLPLELLALVMPIRLVSYFLPNAVQGIGRSDILLRNTMWSTLIVPPLLFLGAQHGGVVGLSVAWLVALPIAFLQNTRRNLPVIGLSLSQFLRAMLPAALAGLVMYSAVLGTRAILPTPQPGVIRLLALIFAGVVGYAIGSWLLNRRGIAEVRRFLLLVALGDKPRSVGQR